MKAYVFIETGEVKIPVKGEWVVEDNCIYLTNRDHCHGALPILARHEIPIPEGAKILHYWLDSIIDADVTHINLPRPKKKVKRYRFYIVDEDDFTDYRYTEEEAKLEFNGYELVRIEASMREVEE